MSSCPFDNTTLAVLLTVILVLCFTIGALLTKLHLVRSRLHGMNKLRLEALDALVRTTTQMNAVLKATGTKDYGGTGGDGP